MQTGPSNRGKPRRCLLPLGLALLATLLTGQSVAAQTSSTRPDSDVGRIAAAAGGRLQFVQTGRTLTIPDADGLKTTDIQLPYRWTAEDAARLDGVVWLTGRSNAADVDDMFVATVDQQGTISLQPTPGGREHPRVRTNLMIDLGRLVGITWLEGTTQETTSVRAAAWSGQDWEETEVVAPPLGTEQTLLRSVVLADGSWLAVWAAVDADDDIWWSLRTGRKWSAPQRLHPDNDVSDVDPVVAATARGALVAWTSFDGSDFRIRLAALNQGQWLARSITSGKAAIPRTFIHHHGVLALLYDTFIPEAWNWVELDDEGRVRRHLSHVGSEDGVPMVKTDSDKVFAFWPNDGAADSGVEFMQTADPDQ